MTMNPTVSKDDSLVDWDRIHDLFLAVGWGERSPDDIRAAFSRSSQKRFAFIGKRLVGFCRTIDDGLHYAMICDLVVDPEFQGQGIGSLLLEELKIACEGFRFLTLTAAEGKDEFYLKQGWQRQRSAFIWPRDEKQARIHAINPEAP